MIPQGQLRYLSPLVKLILLFVTSVSLAMFTGSVFAFIVSADLASLDQFAITLQGDINLMRWFQIIQSFCVFIIPSLLAFWLFFPSFKEGLNGVDKPNMVVLLLTISLMIFGQGLIGWSAWLNQQLQLPESMQVVYDWMMTKENETRAMTDQMIGSESWQTVLVTILMMSILPAIGEEWLFRGIMQKELGRLFRGPHLAIFITAIVFSAIHMQFFTFLPRFILGLIMGYLFYFSRSLWTPVLAHFANNFMAVIMYMVMHKTPESGTITDQVPKIMTEDAPPLISAIFGLFIIVSCLYVIRIICKRNSLPDL